MPVDAQSNESQTYETEGIQPIVDHRAFEVAL